MARKKDEQAPKKVNNPDVVGLRAEILEQGITETLEVNYMPYAMSVIVSRAIPEIDGFKPSHRKILYTMYKMGLLTGGRTKSANIVGTMRLNPTETAPSETLVRLSRGHGRYFVDSKVTSAKSTRATWPTPPPDTPNKARSICNELFRDITRMSWIL